MPVKALSRLFRGKCRARIRKAALLDQIPPKPGSRTGTSTARRSPTPRPIQYLAPYVFKVAISDHRILKVEENAVSFSYKKPGSTRLRTLTLDPLEFIRRFLQHVLPKGFMKVRYYGFLSPTAKLPLEDIKALVELAHGFTVTVPEIELPPWSQPNGQEPGFYEVQDEPICQACGGPLRFHSAVRTPAALGLCP